MAKKELEQKAGQIFGYLDDKESKALMLGSWGDGDTKIQIRKIYEKDGVTKMGGGISLSIDEAEELHTVLNNLPFSMRSMLNAFGDTKDDDDEGRTAVNFDEIFGSTEEIVTAREEKHKTLTRRK